MDFVQIMIVSTLVEGVFEAIKPLWDAEKRQDAPETLGALGLGVVVALLGGIQLFAAAGVPLDNFAVLAPYPDIVLTGIVIGRGASYAHNLIKAVGDVGASFAE